MADSGLFVGWGAPVRGRETVGLGVFNEAIQFWSAQQEAGAIESFETVLLRAARRRPRRLLPDPRHAGADRDRARQRRTSGACTRGPT